jgi:hypothetical protein
MQRDYMEKLDPGLESLEAEDVIDNIGKKYKTNIKALAAKFWSKDDDEDIGYDKIVF